MPMILVWNIEMYGAKFTNNTPIHQLGTIMRDQLIATTIAGSGADIVILQEIRQNGIPRLPVLCDLLSQTYGQTDWHFDVVRGAVDSYNNVPQYPTFDNLIFSQSANNEAYAVLWRSNSVTLQPIPYGTGQQQGTFAQSYGQDSTVQNAQANHFIALANEGYSFSWRPDGNSINIFIDTQGALPMGPIGFPFSNIPTIVDDDYKNRNILNRTLTRRPVTVYVQYDGGTLPIVAYHAPVHLNSSIAGTAAATVCKELYSIDAHGAYPTAATRIFAGDFNLKTATNNLSANTIAGAGGLNKTIIDADGDSPGTIVRPFDYANNTYNDDSYAFTSRDYVFGAGNLTHCQIYDPIELFNNGNALAAALTGNAAINALLVGPDNILGEIDVPPVNLSGGTWIDVLTNYLTGDGIVDETDQQNICSVFYRVFVSDHLPMQVTYGGGN